MGIDNFLSVVETKLYVIAKEHIDHAWAEGASNLSIACAKSDGECTGSQMKTRLSLGGLTLLCVREGFKPKAWIAVRFLQFSNLRALHVEAIYAPGATDAFPLLEEYAKRGGASVIQGACDDAVARLWHGKFGFKKAYTIMRKAL